MLISLIGLFELYRVMKTEKTPLGAAGYISVLLWYGNLYFNRENNEFFMVAIISFLLVTTLVVFVCQEIFSKNIKLYLFRFILNLNR